MLYINFFFENRTIYEIMWKKYCTAGQTTDDNMAHACWKLTSGHTYTHRISNTYCSSIATVVARRRLNVMLHVYCLSCLETINMVVQILFPKAILPMLFTPTQQPYTARFLDHDSIYTYFHFCVFNLTTDL